MGIPLSRHEMELADRNQGQAADPELHPEVVFDDPYCGAWFSHKTTTERMRQARRASDIYLSERCATT
jgi:hypothetical protein